MAKMILALLVGSAAAYGTRVGTEGHGIWHRTPECVSVWKRSERLF